MSDRGTPTVFPGPTPHPPAANPRATPDHQRSEMTRAMPQQRTTWHVGKAHTWAAGDYFGDTPAGSLDSMGRLVTRLAAALHRQQATEGLILLDAEAAALTGITEPTTEDGRRQRALDSAAEAGWRHSKIRAITSFFAAERPTIHVGQLARLTDPSDPGCWPFGHRYPADTVAALQAWHRLTGVAWQQGSPVMGLELMHRTITSYQVIGQKGRRKPDLKDDSTPDEASVSMWSREMWHRPAQHRWMHGYDKRRAGITAAGVAKLSPAKLTRRRGPYDPKRAGWWLVTVPSWNVKEMPHPFGPGAADLARRVGGGNRMWVTTATMDLAAELAAAGVLSMPDVIDSLTGVARPVLAPWQQLIERAYAAPMDPDTDYDDIAQGLVRGALKEAGNAGIGLIGKAVRDEDEDGKTDSVPSIWRRDWHAGVNATKQANAWRTAWKIGTTEQRWPVCFDDDKLWYSSDDDDPVRAAPRTTNDRGQPLIDLRHDTPGGYRPEDTVERGRKK